MSTAFEICSFFCTIRRKETHVHFNVKTASYIQTVNDTKCYIYQNTVFRNKYRPLKQDDKSIT